MILGGWRALRQYDIKLLLAYGTVSQLGFLIAHVRARHPVGRAGRASRCSSRHALFKADAVPGRRHRRPHHRHPRPAQAVRGRPRDAGGRRWPPRWPARRWPAVPPLIGFTAKEAAFESLTYLLADGDGTGIPPLAGAAAGRGAGGRLGADRRVHAALLWGAFADQAQRRQRRAGEPTCRPVPAGFAAAPVLLAALCLVGGFVGPQLTAALQPRTPTPFAVGRGEPRHRAVARLHACRCCISVLALVGRCAAVLAARAGSAGSQATFPRSPEAEEVYQATMRGRRPAGGRGHRAAPSAARCRSTSASILLVVVVLPGGVLLLTADWPAACRLVRHPGPAAGRRDDGRRRVPGRHLARPAEGGDAGRGHRLRHGAAVPAARRARPRPHPDPGRDRHPGGLRAGAAQAAQVLHRPAAALDAAGGGW